MVMKIYFAGSIRGGRRDKDLYYKLIKYLSNYGEVLTEHIGNDNLKEHGEKNMNDIEIFSRDMSWLRDADVFIAEVSTPSLGVGYEIAKAEEMNKKILCLYRKHKNNILSAMIRGNPNIKVVDYEDFDDVVRKINKFFDYFSN